MITLDYAMRVATTLQSENKLEQAEIIINNILDAHPIRADALHLSGIIAYQRGNIILGIELIQKAIAHHSSVAVFHSNLGEMYRQLKDSHTSILCGKKAVALDPQSATALANLGIAYYDAKQYEQAEDCHQRALAIHPTLCSALNNLGSLYKTSGKTQQAIAFYQRAIAATPHWVEPFNNLGVLFLEQQEFKLACEYLRQAITLTPTFADAQCNLGLAFIGLDHYSEALQHFEKALQLKPEYAESYYGIAKVHLHRHDFILAEANINKAIAIHPQQVEFYSLLAEIYDAQGNPAQAQMYLDYALSIDSTVASLHLSKGTLFMESGEIYKAEEQFLKVAADSTIDNRILAHYCLVQLHKTKIESPHLKALLSLADTLTEVSPSKQEYIYFALGKCYDDLGEWEKAFAYFSQGCNLKRKRISYHISEQMQLTQKLIDCFTQETIEYLRTFANPSALPLFIVGMPRSGTTLVEQILASHPHVHGAGELTYLNDLIQWPVEYQQTTLHYPDNIRQLPPEALQAITDQYLAYVRRISSEALHITDKMPQNFMAIGLIHALFPHAKIIHVKRNPIDTCLSCYTKLFRQGHLYSYDLTELGQYYNCYERIMNHWRHILPAHAFMEVEYENMIHHLDTEAKRLTDYCDLPWDPNCLAFYRSKRQVCTASFMQVREPLYTSSINRWRRFENELAPLIKSLTEV